MGNYHPMTAAQWAAQDVFNEMPLLDTEFDHEHELDFHDEHLVELEVTGQFTSIINP